MTKLSSQHDQAGFATAFAPFGALDPSAVDAAIKAGVTYAQAWLSWQAEILMFISNRFVWDSRISEALAKCKTPADMAEVQQNWLMTTAQDYFNEMNRLAQFGWKLMPSITPGLAVAPEREHPTQHAAE